MQESTQTNQIKEQNQDNIIDKVIIINNDLSRDEYVKAIWEKRNRMSCFK